MPEISAHYLSKPQNNLVGCPFLLISSGFTGEKNVIPTKWDASLFCFATFLKAFPLRTLSNLTDKSGYPPGSSPRRTTKARCTFTSSEKPLPPWNIIPCGPLKPRKMSSSYARSSCPMFGLVCQTSVQLFIIAAVAALLKEPCSTMVDRTTPVMWSKFCLMNVDRIFIAPDVSGTNRNSVFLSPYIAASEIDPLNSISFEDNPLRGVSSPSSEQMAETNWNNYLIEALPTRNLHIVYVQLFAGENANICLTGSLFILGYSSRLSALNTALSRSIVFRTTWCFSWLLMQTGLLLEFCNPWPSSKIQLSILRV